MELQPQYGHNGSGIIYSTKIKDYKIDNPKSKRKSEKLSSELSPQSLKILFLTEVIIETIEEKTIEELKMIKDKIIRSFNDNSNKNNYWKSLDEIASLISYSSKEIEYVMENSEPDSFLGSFVQNSEGSWTTRNLYSKYTPFLKKVYDSYTLRFN